MLTLMTQLYQTKIDIEDGNDFPNYNVKANTSFNVVVTLIDFNMNPVSNKSIVLYCTKGNFTNGSDAIDGQTNNDGKFSVRYTAPNELGLVTFGCENSNISINVYEDTGWQNITLKSGFSAHATSAVPRFRCRNGVVRIVGAVKPSSNIAATDYIEVGTFNNAYAPSSSRICLNQGSNNNKLMVNVTRAGTIGIGRYGTTSSIQIPSGTWLNLGITYFKG